MEKKKDLRIIKTQNLLYETLISFLKEKTFEEIKVSDLCSRALINRSTFYAHYNDKYELLIDLINNLKMNLLSALEKNEHIVNTKEYYIKMIKILLNQIESKKDVYCSILVNNRNSVVMDIIFDVVSKDISSRIKEESGRNNIIPTEIITKFYIGAVTMVIMEWINDNKYSKDEIINYLDDLIPKKIAK